MAVDGRVMGVFDDIAVVAVSRGLLLLQLGPVYDVFEEFKLRFIYVLEHISSAFDAT